MYPFTAMQSPIVMTPIFALAIIDPTLIGRFSLRLVVLGICVPVAPIATMIILHPSGSCVAMLWFGHQGGRSVFPSHATSSLAMRILHLHLAVRRRARSPGSTCPDSCIAKSPGVCVYSGPACLPCSDNSWRGWTIHCHRPVDHRFVWSASVHLWPLCSLIARFFEPTHICSRSNSARRRVASLPPFISIIITSPRRSMLTLSGHLSHFIPPRVPYFSRSGTLVCTDDVLHMRFLTSCSTSAMSFVDMFINLSL